MPPGGTPPGHDPVSVRVLVWNLFHCRDGLPGLGPDWRSTFLGRPVDDGVHVHLNRKLTRAMAARIRAAAADLVALQEVPTGAVAELAALTGLRAHAVATGPLVGPRAVRDALARRNPDLWRTHEGNANVLLVAPRLGEADPGPRGLTLNPPATILREARHLRLGAAEVALWLAERRRALIVPLVLPGGRRLVAACVHLHNARDRRVTAGELMRAVAAVERRAGTGPALIAGDLNLPPGDPVFDALEARGWACPRDGLGIDRVLHRGLRGLAGPSRLTPGWRDAEVRWRGARRRVRLSDHDAVLAELAAA